jgi:large subunit ribosomal protein L31e
MAETKPIAREYTIPLRRTWINVPQYERTGKAVKAIKKFIAKHMKVPNRDPENVKLDVYFNNEVWFRGRANPPSKIKVKATKEGDIVKVTFVTEPKHISFLRSKHSRNNLVSETKAEEKPVESKEEKTTEQKKDEVEKEKSVEMQNIKDAEKKSKEKKHTQKLEGKKTQPTRMALDRH